MPGADDHYFTAEPASPDERRQLAVRLAGRDVQVQTAPGVFSGSRLDPGTQVLLRTVPAPPPTGELLDLGCGWGPIALSLAMLAPEARVWAVDVNRRALDLVTRNASALGLTGVRAVEPAQVPADLGLAALWSNPPIRVGKPALHALLATWLPRLAPDGEAWLVIQRSLGADSLQAWIGEELHLPAERVASSKGFRVLRVTRR